MKDYSHEKRQNRKTPLPIRNELNFRMDCGKDGAEILKWLNELPEVRDILESRFDGVPISKQNLSEWRKGGFPEWQRHREWIYQACELHNCTEDMENVLTPPLMAGDLAACSPSVTPPCSSPGWRAGPEIRARPAPPARHGPGHRPAAKNLAARRPPRR